MAGPPGAQAGPTDARAGAGDAFAAVLILGILRDWSLESTLERANRFASRIAAQAADPGLCGPFIDASGLAPTELPSPPPPPMGPSGEARPTPRGRRRPRPV